MYHRVRQKMRLVVCAILILVPNYQALPTIEDVVPETKPTTEPVDNYENNVIDFDDEFSVRFNNKYDVVPWRSTTDKHVKDSHRYTIVKDDLKSKPSVSDKLPSIVPKTNTDIINEPTTETDYSVIPLELISTTENYLLSIIESTTDQDLSVIPLTAAKRKVPTIEITQTVTLPPSTQETDTTTDTSRDVETTTKSLNETKVQTTVSTNQTLQKNKTQEKSDNSEVTTTSKHVSTTDRASYLETTTVNIGQFDFETKDLNRSETTTTRDIPIEILSTTADSTDVELNATEASTTNYDKAANGSSNKPVSANNRAPKALISNVKNDTEIGNNTLISIKYNKTRNNDLNNANKTKTDEALKTNSTNQNENVTRFTIDSIEEGEKDVPVFTELDAEDEEVPEDYYDAKDVVPTTAPKASALSVLVGLAGSVVESVVESVAERVVPKGIYDLFRRMQRQSEALEAERLRSREENGGLGQFGRGILKSISSGLSKPLSQLMAGAKDIGSLDSDRGFISSLASGVTSVATVATSMADSFKDRVQAIYPGTVWCGDGHSPTARSGELGLFFFTDTCCRQHDACKIYIKAGETKYGLTNTGLFTRSHCSCDAKFRECLRRTNSLVSAQIGLTYFNVLGPQCFRRAHPIVKCLKRTRITGQKCEEYEFDYTKPKMWQWFDNETF